MKNEHRPNTGYLQKRWFIHGISALVAILGFATSLAIYSHSSQLVQSFLMQLAWANTLETHQPSKPWPGASFWPAAKISLENHNRQPLFVLADERNPARAKTQIPTDTALVSEKEGIENGILHLNMGSEVLQALIEGDVFHLQTPDGSTKRYLVVKKVITDLHAPVGLLPHVPSSLTMIAHSRLIKDASESPSQTATEFLVFIFATALDAQAPSEPSSWI